jgi:hypothetical protein
MRIVADHKSVEVRMSLRWSANGLVPSSRALIDDERVVTQEYSSSRYVIAATQAPCHRG